MDKYKKQKKEHPEEIKLKQEQWKKDNEASLNACNEIVNKHGIFRCLKENESKNE